MQEAKVGEIWVRKNAYDGRLEKVEVIAIDKKFIHIKDANGKWQVLKEKWNEYFKKA